MRVLLTRKLAGCIDGIDLSGCNVGDVLELPSPEAGLLIAEQWAIRERRSVARGEGARRYVSQASDRKQPDTHQRPATGEISRRPLEQAADTAARPQTDRPSSRSRGKRRS
jgi:hypothetical protein